MAKSPTMERIEEALDSQLHAIKYNMQRVFRLLLWPLVMEVYKNGEGHNLGQDIDTLVREVVNTSYYDGHECSTWDKDKDVVHRAAANLRTALVEKGIK